MNTQNQLERAVLGLAMTSQRDRSDLQGTKLEWFTHPTNANTWRIIQALDADGQAVDELTITGNLHYADEMSRRNITVTDLAAMRVEAPVGHVGSAPRVSGDDPGPGSQSGGPASCSPRERG